MPQQPKTPEQIALEQRIATASGLVKTMQLQLQSIRRRNRASREKARRQTKVSELREKQDKAFKELLKDIDAAENAPPVIATSKELKKLDAIAKKNKEKAEAAAAAGEKSSSSTSVPLVNGTPQNGKK